MPITHPPPPVTRLGTLKGFMAIFIPMCLVLMIIGIMHYYTFYTTERSSIESSELLNVDLAKRMIEKDIADVVSDLLFLAEHIERRGLPEALPWAREQRIAEEFKVFAKNKGLYDQIRYIDKTGVEVVRINYLPGESQVVPESKLQNKANRYYFKEALALDRGRIYLSPFDLNMEEGKIEFPLKPVIRFGTPVFDSQGEKRGIVLLNYLGDRLIQNFTQAAANIADHIELVNNGGYWLSSPRDEDEWGFMLGHDARFQVGNAYEWRKVTAGDKGQIQTDNGLFTYTTIRPRIAAMSAKLSGRGSLVIDDKPSNYWKIISRISSRELSATLPFFIQNHYALYLAMLVLVAGAAWLLAYSQQHRRAAMAQRDYEQRFRYTLENIELAAVTLNLKGDVTFCNDYFLKISGWNKDEVIGRNWLRQFVPDELADEIGVIIKKMGDPDSFPLRYENKVKVKSDGLRLIAWNNTLSYDADGNVIGVTGIGEDITDKRKAETDLLKLYQAVEQSPSAVIITNDKGLIEYVNPKFTKVSGYESQEVLGRNPRFLKSGETSQEEYKNLWNTVLEGGEWRGEFHNRRKNGELYWEGAVISAIRNAEGKITHFLAVKEDITVRKRLEAEVEQQNRDLARSETLAAMGRMASMIAHDLRNPLSSVKMTLQILGKQLDMEVDSEVKGLCNASLEQIRYMEEILSDMLTYSRPDALKLEWLTIDKIIDMSISLSQRRIDEYKIKLITNYHSGLPTLHADATKLRQVFSNLISNAAQATECSSEPMVAIDVMLELGMEGTAIRIEICDNGCGINEEEREKIFEPFFTTWAKGTGLGLAIVKRILDQHQANISITQNIPSGSCVTVVIPVRHQINMDDNAAIIQEIVS
ncbi:MAG: PAS domain S-box protein [Candidatus Thiodiazotropha sp. (ex Dulcina madagascariensis)]|nr:PAS domain S-box protein [Candidatus Thiodiazotropha sp. (ex Dulcina madagascariensis)]MCU7926924.1 PAS domain S-box protein [Candidatus Thiodiazotropha sp. (ex Dulcina madagascariensis)]